MENLEAVIEERNLRYEFFATEMLPGIGGIIQNKNGSKPESSEPLV